MKPRIEESCVGSDGQWSLIDAARPLLLDSMEQGRFPAGWYSLVLESIASTADLVEPALYPDYGDGFREQDRIPLKQFREAGGQGLRGVICLVRPARALRLVVSLWSRVKLTGILRVRRIGRMRACLMMLRLGSFTYGQRALPARIFGAMRALGQEGAHGLGSWLYENELNLDPQVDDGIEYRDWVTRFDSNVAASVPAPRMAMLGDSRPIHFSVLVPVFNTRAAWLLECVDSVFAQSYPDWQLCIADDASTSEETRAALAQIHRRDDPRVNIVWRMENGHISAASNSALQIATGEFIVLLDHDDLLHPEALAEFAAAILRHPEWALVYSDEDKIDESGRSDPYFKPDFDLDLLRGHNCVSHLSAYKRADVEAIGGFSLGVEGSQDWDLALRFIERVGKSRVGHIPRVLYHWRKSEQSTASSASAKAYAGVAALRAINAHLERTMPGAKAAEIGDHPGNYRTHFPLPTAKPIVSVLIPTRDHPEMLHRCIRSVAETSSDFDLQYLIMDNGSVLAESKQMFDQLSRQYSAKVLHDDRAFNYSSLCNQLAAKATGDVLLFLNDDVEAIHAGWLEEMVSLALRDEVGAVGAKLYYPDGRIQHAGIILGFEGVAGNALRGNPGSDSGMMNRAYLLQGVSAVTGACMAMRRQVFEHIGGFDEALAVAFNDVDICLRLRTAGKLVLWTPFAELVHHESLSRGIDSTTEALVRAAQEVRLMSERWRDWIEYDPAYNPNLSLKGDSYRLAIPPRAVDFR